MSREIKVTLNRPHRAQAYFLENRTRFSVLMCGRRFGKSLIAQHLSTEFILGKKYVGYVPPTYSLAKVFYSDMLRLLPNALIKSSNKADLVIELITGGMIVFLTGEKPDNFRGRKFHLVIVDEAAYVKDFKDAWNNAIRPTLTDYKGEAVFISTPRGKGDFHSFYLKGLNKEKDWSSFVFDTYRNPYIDPEEIDQAKSDLPEAAFNQEYLAIPAENANNPFTKSALDKCKMVSLSRKPVVQFGIDLAKTSDYTVIIGLDDDGKMAYYDRFQKPWELTKDSIKRLPRHIPKLIDSTGVGDVIVEELSRDIPNIKGYKFTAQSKPQLIISLIKAMELGQVGYIEEIEDELAVFEYKIQSTGYVKYEAQGGFHDDKVIALALANYERRRKSILSSIWNMSAV